MYKRLKNKKFLAEWRKALSVMSQNRIINGIVWERMDACKNRIRMVRILAFAISFFQDNNVSLPPRRGENFKSGDGRQTGARIRQRGDEIHVCLVTCQPVSYLHLIMQNLAKAVCRANGFYPTLRSLSCERGSVEEFACKCSLHDKKRYPKEVRVSLGIINGAKPFFVFVKRVIVILVWWNFNAINAFTNIMYTKSIMQ